VHCSNGLPLPWFGRSGSERARPILAFRPEAEPGEAFSPIGIDGLPAKSGLPRAGGQWWSGRGASRQGGGIEGGGLTGRLVCGRGDRQQGKDIGKLE
jgi:hypothetical protein